jgi:hypothetical protein
MDLLQRLGHLNGPTGFPLAEPNFAINSNPARDNVDMVMVGVLVARRDIWNRIGKPHPPHKILDDLPPLIGRQALSFG